MPDLDERQQEQLYGAMDDDEKSRVADAVRAGASISWALRKTMAGKLADRERNVASAGHEAEAIQAGPTATEKAGAFGLGVADVIAEGSAPSDVGIGDIAAGVANPLFAGRAGLGMVRKGIEALTQANETQVREEAKETAPAQYGAGELTGAAAQSAMMPGALKPGYAGTGLPSMARIKGALGAAGTRLKGAGAELAREGAAGEQLTKAGAIKRAIRALLGEGGEVQPAQVVDEAAAAPRQEPRTATEQDYRAMLEEQMAQPPPPPKEVGTPIEQILPPDMPAPTPESPIVPDEVIPGLPPDLPAPTPELPLPSRPVTDPFLLEQMKRQAGVGGDQARRMARAVEFKRTMADPNARIGGGPAGGQGATFGEIGDALLKMPLAQRNAALGQIAQTQGVDNAIRVMVVGMGMKERQARMVLPMIVPLR